VVEGGEPGGVEVVQRPEVGDHQARPPEVVERPDQPAEYRAEQWFGVWSSVTPPG
jgi:hypothetical protein